MLTFNCADQTLLMLNSWIYHPLGRINWTVSNPFVSKIPGGLCVLVWLCVTSWWLMEYKRNESRCCVNRFSWGENSSLNQFNFPSFLKCELSMLHLSFKELKLLCKYLVPYFWSIIKAWNDRLQLPGFLVTCSLVGISKARIYSLCFYRQISGIFRE